MAEEGVIRNFMVALGFKTDNTGLGQMQDAMGRIELKSASLKVALLTLATGAVIAVRQTASELDKLYFSSQRIGASATNITAFGNAISQMGGNAESAIGTLESLAEKMRNSPGYEGMINSLGVNTKQANGEMRDRVDVMKDLSGVLAQMPAYQANAYANSLGIDQNTLLAMRDGKFVSNMEKYQKIQEQLGMNDDLTKSGNEFMTEYRDLTMVTKTGFQVIVMQAGKALIPILRLLNQLIQAGISAFSQLNPEIKQMLGVGLRFGMLALVLGGFIKTFGMIFKFIPMIKSFIGVLKLFRLAFLASPIGIILALAAALALLYDDYKTWRDGGKSLFDWSKWTNGIETIINKIKDFLDLLDKIKDKVINFVQKVISDPVGAVQEVVETTKDVLSNVGNELANPTPDENGEVSAPRDTIANGVDTGFGLVDKGLAFFGDKDAQERVNQRERGEIGYKPQPKIETPKNAKELAIFAENADHPNKQLKNADIPSNGNALTKLSNDIKNITQTGVNAVVNVATMAQNVVSEAVLNNSNSSSFNRVAPIKSGAKGTKQVEFIQKYWGMAVKIAEALNTKPDLVISQFAAETGWGTSIIKGTNNLGNIKAGKNWKGDTVKAYDRIEKSYDPYKVYKTPEDFAEDYIQLVGKSKRYQNVKNSKTANEFYSSLKKAGYATDVKYVDKGIKMHKSVVSRLDEDRISVPTKKQNSISKNSPSTVANSIPPKMPIINSYAPPSGNPDKTNINNLISKMNASNVNIHQEFKTDMTINGAKEPIESANAVKRQQENSMAVMARNAKSIFA